METCRFTWFVIMPTSMAVWGGETHYNIIILQFLMVTHPHCTMEIKNLFSCVDLPSRVLVARLKKLKDKSKWQFGRSPPKIVWSLFFISCPLFLYITSPLLYVTSLIFLLTPFLSPAFCPFLPSLTLLS